MRLRLSSDSAPDTVMSMPKEEVVVYDGALECRTCRSAKCPKVVLQSDNRVRIFDPDKPESGSFTMSVEEWNSMVNTALPIVV